MAEIEFSIMFDSDNAVEILKKILTKFENKFHTTVNLTVLNWDDAWQELVQAALYKVGPDVSEIGSTWITDLAQMNALQPFSAKEIRSFGGEDNFLPASWKTAKIAGQNEVWGIPWFEDTRLIYYRKDLLQNAGVDENTAFQSHAQLVTTLEKLQASGVKIPWVVPTERSWLTLQFVASWIWTAGGRFLSEDGKQVAFDQPAALKGLTEYFSLARFLHPDAYFKDDHGSQLLFSAGQAAVTLSGPWFRHQAENTPHVLQNMGFTSPPGHPCMGGSHLAIWNHAKRKHQAINLINFLLSPEAQAEYCQAINMLPTRRDVITNPAFSENPAIRNIITRLENGRSFPSVPLWGKVENRLSLVLGNVWSSLLKEPEQDIETVLKDHLLPLAKMLNTTLANY